MGAYCEAGFHSKYIHDFQLVYERPQQDKEDDNNNKGNKKDKPKEEQDEDTVETVETASLQQLGMTWATVVLYAVLLGSNLVPPTGRVLFAVLLAAALGHNHMMHTALTLAPVVTEALVMGTVSSAAAAFAPAVADIAATLALEKTPTVEHHGLVAALAVLLFARVLPALGSIVAFSWCGAMAGAAVVAAVVQSAWQVWKLAGCVGNAETMLKHARSRAEIIAAMSES